MVAYSFQKRFIKPIEDGSKRQTIRGKGKRRHANVGDQLQLYFAQRTQHCRKIIDDVPCLGQSVCVLTLEHGEITGAEVDGQKLTDLDAFAVADGFEDIDDMSQFWREHNKAEGYSGETYELALIRW
jgi:hypothetical protein